MSAPREQVNAAQLWFTAPLSVEIRHVSLAAPSPLQVLVRTRYSAVSAGTELLVYRGQLPESLALDSSLQSLQQSSGYPLQYGYSCVGEVLQVGSEVDPAWLGCQVFSFQPHASHFLASPDELIKVPAGIPPEDAVFLPNMETAVNLIQDGQPLLGERVVVVGQGIVGLLLTALLADHPLASLAAIEGQPARQKLARKLGADIVCGPDEATAPDSLSASQRQALMDADLIYEVSGHPEALNLAIALTGFASRICIGSWYGDKTAPIDLGGAAHRNRLQLITSQVSTLAPALSGRWDKQRRYRLAWDMIRQIQPRQLVSHTVRLREASDCYRQLHEQQPDFVQLLFNYEEE